MHEKPAIKDFLKQIIVSGLVKENVLRQVIGEFNQEYADNIKKRNDLVALTTFLVQKELLTCWQCNKLRHGHYHGFFVDDYRLLDYIGSDEKASTFLAEHIETGHRVALAVEPPPHFTYSVARDFAKDASNEKHES